MGKRIDFRVSKNIELPSFGNELNLEEEETDEERVRLVKTFG